MNWEGTKRVAFVPVDRGRFNDFPPPPNWEQAIEERIYCSLSDRSVNNSLRDYIHTVSNGVADIEGSVQPVQQVGVKDVPPGFLDSELGPGLRAQGFDAAALVMLGNRPVGQAEAPGFWVRVSHHEPVGVWAMELTHTLCYYMDLYTNDTANDLNSFDNMDCSCGTHPTAYTKAQIGWVDPSLIALDSLPDETFDLYSAGLVLPPPSGRTAAVQIQSSGNPLFVESRQRLDQYDGGHGPTGQNDDWGNSTGIASEGVIVYELAGVENPTTPFPGEIDPLIRLHTQQALQPGQKWTSPSGIVVSVTAALVGGFRVTIQNPETTIAVPGVIGMPPAAASHTITQAGLVPKFTPPTGLWVNSQSPVAGHQAARGSTVTMHLASHGEPP